MGPVFARRRRCFYCGQRSAQSDKGVIRSWRCANCEAVNYLDENGDITDPPPEVTNPDSNGPEAPEQPFESLDFTKADLFCAKCVRNQHLYTSALASYLPSPDDPAYDKYEKDYPRFRKNMEERYPQVCKNCEPRVNARIRKSLYQAKTDFLGRMLERSKAAREMRRARRLNWRTWLVSAGAIGFWSSVAGQLVWNAMSVLSARHELHEPAAMLSIRAVLRCSREALQARAVPRECAVNLAPYAGVSLLVGLLAFWWNPMLRFKVEGRVGRLTGLGEYYKFQLVFMVARSVFWALLKDPASSGLRDNLPPVLHLTMIFVTILSLIASQFIVQFDTRPLVNWSAWNPSSYPSAQEESQTEIEEPALLQPHRSETGNIPKTEKRGFHTKSFGYNQPVNSPSAKAQKSKQSSAMIMNKTSTVAADRDQFSIEKFLPVSERADEMDWTPTRQYDLRPSASVQPAQEKSVLDGMLPFYGSLPPAPTPPAWKARNPPAERPPAALSELNPFSHALPPQAHEYWKPSSSSDINRQAEPIFANPKFFPPSDYNSTTGLESLFDRTFTIKSLEDEDGRAGKSAQSSDGQRRSAGLDRTFGFQFLRVLLLLMSGVSWLLSEHGLISVAGNYIEVFSLSSVSLVSGFTLLEILKFPISQWNGMDILVCFAELAAAVHLGGNLPRVSIAREYFDRYGKLLLVFMIAQEALTMWSLYRERLDSSSAKTPAAANASHRVFGSLARERASPTVGSERQLESQSFTSHTSVLEAAPRPDSARALARPSSQQSQPFNPYPTPSLSSQATMQPASQAGFASFNQSFSSTRSMFSAEQPTKMKKMQQGHHSGYSDASSNDGDNDGDDSDAETAATTTTNSTVENIRNGWHPRAHIEPAATPAAEPKPLFANLSLDDQPAPRVMTRSQTRQRLQAERYPSFRGF